MGEQRTIELSEEDLERAWQLTCALATNDNGPRHTLDVLFITSARFVDRLAQGLAGDGMVLDSGKAGPNGPLTYLVRRKP